MVSFLLLLAGLALGVLIGREWLKPPSKDPAPGNAPAAPGALAGPVAAAAGPADLASRLYPLRQAIESFAESSSHPREVANHNEFLQAVAVLADDAVPLDVVLEYAIGANWALSAAAFAAFGQRKDQDEALQAILPKLPNVGAWPLHFALGFVEGVAIRPPVGETLLRAAEHCENHPLIPQLFLAHFKRRESLGDSPSFGPGLMRAQTLGEGVEPLLKRVEHPISHALLAEINAWKAARVDRAFLNEIGRVWEDAADRLLFEHVTLRDPLQTALTAITHQPPRSVLMVGESRVGKSSAVRLLAVHLRERGYQIFEASGPELMAGQKYIGELEGRIRRLVTELASSKRVVWYIPEFLQILLSGSHRGQAASILDQVLPEISAGRLIVISECTPGGLTRALQMRPALRNAIDVVRLRPMDAAETAALTAEFLAGVARELEIQLAPGMADAAMRLASHYLGGMQLPGAVLDLLKLAANRAAATPEATLDRSTLLATLSQITGLPRVVLDDSEKIALSEIRAFFSSRVIGQDEAVAAVVDRIAMLKAGLTDPGRPVAVFLFAGPTGTGKTELAKTLAEYLFGTAERLLRLDMSEFQAAGSVEKIIGASDDETQSQSLIQRVRKQPFAVILLDEFEKAHANVWDLFLQVFDDGRLTDSLGQTADFRHTIIILTSNLGATAHQSAGVGFAPRGDAFSQEQVRRAVGQTFRPEFVNRLDKVIVFRPLTRERMRSILRKELARVLERRGLQSREWAVEWESSALEFLLEKGFTADMGARPLKRAIDQHLLAPLAATMVERRFPTGDQFLFVRSDGDAIQVEFVDPNADASTAFPAVPPAVEGEVAGSATHIAGVVLQPTGSRPERDRLLSELARLEAQFSGPQCEGLRDTLVQEMSANDFWDRADRQRVLVRYATMDRVKAALATARSLSERQGRGSAARPGQFSRELAGRLALQLLLVDHGLRDVLRDAPIEVLLAVEPAMESGGDAEQSRRWCRQILDMYCGWAARRRMQLTRREMASGLTVLVITGFGAESVLAREVGMHVLESEAGAARADARRCVARVRVAPLWTLESGANIAATTLEKAWKSAEGGTSIVRRYRFDPSPLVRDAERGWRTGRLQDVLAGDFDLF